jgi:hypothetical protein
MSGKPEPGPHDAAVLGAAGLQLAVTRPHQAASTVFATPSPRLIPKGEKPESFTGLALASFMKAAP